MKRGQKEPFRDVFKIVVLRKFEIFTGKHLSLFNKAAGLKACNFIEKRLHTDFL